MNFDAFSKLNCHPMLDFKLLTMSDLFDLLIDQTAHHMRLISSGATPEEFKISGEILTEIQKEIQDRKIPEFVTQLTKPSSSTKLPALSQLDTN